MILQLVVLQAMGKAGWPAAFPRLATEKDSRRAVAVVVFVTRSSPGIDRPAFLVSALCRQAIGFATVDPVIAAADPFFLAGPGLAAVVAAGSAVAGLVVAVDSAVTVSAVDLDFAVVAAAAADLAYFVDSVCFFAAEKGRAVVAISCSLTPRSSSSRNRNCLWPPCFADRA